MIAAIRGDNALPLGTAVFIDRELALTAKHVVEQFFTSFGAQFPTAASPVPFDVIAFQFLGSASASAIWRAKRIWTAEWTDLALVHFGPWNDAASSYTWPATLCLSAPPPAVGVGVAAFGYPYSSLGLRVGPETTDLDWSVAPTTVTGVVEDVLDEMRDSSLSYPCFQVSARFLGGMSGGPVFARDGELKGMLCGIIGSGFELVTEEVADPISYATSLWPVLGLNIDFKRPDLVCSGLYPLFELPTLHHRGWESIRGRASIEATEHGPRMRLTPA